MSPSTDPFFHHPELRDKIADPQTSYLRGFTLVALAAKLQELGLQVDWWHSDADREAMRMRALARRTDGDLWVFGYGSLMWDPGFHFAEVRRAFVPDHARRFILKDVRGGRGTSAAPGLMAALDRGPGCQGLAFRIDRALVEAETEALWRREQIGPAYVASFVRAELSDTTVEALTFVADHDAALIDAGISRDDQIRFLATGTGFLGSSLDYIRNIAGHFATLGIEDADVTALLRAAEAHIAAGAASDA